MNLYLFLELISVDFHIVSFHDVEGAYLLPNSMLSKTCLNTRLLFLNHVGNIFLISSWKFN